MHIIVDSGSTKTDWRFIDAEGKVSQAQSEGINPNYLSDDQIKENINQTIKDFDEEREVEVHFYGSGCGAEKNKNRISDIFKETIPHANTEIHHDLYGAARSLCGHQKGIACILGTGSNSCLYDGHEITDNIRSLGYLLGDEGSGHYLGKRLLQQYFRNELSDRVRKNLEKRLGDDQSELIRTIYDQDNPVRFVSRLSKFIFQNIKDPGLYRLVYNVMTEFIELNIQLYKDYQNTPVHFTGSVAFYFSNILRQAGADKGINIQHIVESPIAGLTLFHKSHQ